MGGVHGRDANRDGTVSVRIVEATDAAIDAVNGQIQELEAVDEVPEYIANPGFSSPTSAQGLVRELEAAELDARRRRQGCRDRSRLELEELRP